MSGQRRPGVVVDEQLWERFREDVRKRKGGTRGHLREELENALREYIHATQGGDTHDRLRRIENRQEEIRDLLDDLAVDTKSGEECKNKKDSDTSSRVEKRLNRIEGQIHEESNGKNTVHESVVENAIEDNAGGSHPTIRKYKDSLKNRRIAFPWPKGKKWFLDGEMFVNAHESTFPGRFEELVEEYGEQWVYSQLGESESDGED